MPLPCKTLIVKSRTLIVFDRTMPHLPQFASKYSHHGHSLISISLAQKVLPCELVEKEVLPLSSRKNLALLWTCNLRANSSGLFGHVP